jgi:[acyl-carrier-protein] S-malonyltransferase
VTSERTALVFPGLGSHLPQMLDYAAKIAGWTEIRGILADAAGFDPVQIVADEGDAALNRNEIASLLIVAVSVACFHRLRDEGIAFDFTAGYSFGQYTALYASGAIDLPDMLSLVADLAHYMSESRAGTEGTMMAVIGLADAAVEELCRKLSTPEEPLSVANYNSVGQLTLAGTRKAMANAQPALLALTPLRLAPLPVGGAWHSELFLNALPRIMARLERTPLRLPTVPVVDNTQGTVFANDLTEMRHRLADHMAVPLQWRQSIEWLGTQGVGRLIEVGYGDMLTRFGFFVDRKQQYVHWEKAI